MMLSHDNLLYGARSMFTTLELKTKAETVVSYLPLSHIAAQVRFFEIIYNSNEIINLDIIISTIVIFTAIRRKIKIIMYCSINFRYLTL